MVTNCGWVRLRELKIGRGMAGRWETRFESKQPLHLDWWVVGQCWGWGGGHWVSGHNTAGLGLIRGWVLQVLLLSGHPIQKLQPWQGSKHSAHSQDESVRDFGQHQNNETFKTVGLQQQNCSGPRYCRSLFSTLWSLEGHLGCLTWVRCSSCKSRATHSYQCVLLYFTTT